MLRIAGWLMFALVFQEISWAQTIVLTSDLNGRYGSAEYSTQVEKAINRITEIRPDLLIITGDMVAGQRTPALTPDQVRNMWTEFNQVLTRPMESNGIPVAITPGNHDASGYPGFEQERALFESQWHDRRPALDFVADEAWPWHYAAWLDDILLISFDGTMPGRLSRESLDFIERMLRENRPNASHVIVVSHLPMWPLASGRERETIDDQDLLTLLHEYNVDVYASGHHHLFYSGLDDHGLLHVSVGALGGGARAFSGESNRQPRSFAVLEFKEGEIAINAFPAPGFTQALDFGSLPERVIGSPGALVRTNIREYRNEEIKP